MRIHFTLVAAVALLAACGDSPAAPAAPTSRPAAAYFDDLPEEKANVRYDGSGTEYAPCWNGEGELVTFHGNIHFMYSTRRDAMGRTVLRQHWNPQGLRGIGWQSGLRYVANGTFRSREWYLPGGELPQDFTFQDRWRYVSQGSTADFDRIVDFRLTMNDAGELVVVKERESIECR